MAGDSKIHTQLSRNLRIKPQNPKWFKDKTLYYIDGQESRFEFM